MSWARTKSSQSQRDAEIMSEPHVGRIADAHFARRQSAEQ